MPLLLGRRNLKTSLTPETGAAAGGTAVGAAVGAPIAVPASPAGENPVLSPDPSAVDVGGGANVAERASALRGPAEWGGWGPPLVISTAGADIVESGTGNPPSWDPPSVTCFCIESINLPQTLEAFSCLNNTIHSVAMGTCCEPKNHWDNDGKRKGQASLPAAADLLARQRKEGTPDGQRPGGPSWPFEKKLQSWLFALGVNLEASAEDQRRKASGCFLHS